MTTEAQTTASRFWIEDGILKSEVLRPVSLTSQQVIESIDVMWEMTGGRPMPRLAFNGRGHVPGQGGAGTLRPR